MSVPDGAEVTKPNQVCKLLKSLYGLKQASRKLYEKLTYLLFKEGYTQSISDYFLFTLCKDNTFSALLVYIVDVIFVWNSLKEFERIKIILDDAFKIQDLGQLKYFIGL